MKNISLKCLLPRNTFAINLKIFFFYCKHHSKAIQKKKQFLISVALYKWLKKKKKLKLYKLRRWGKKKLFTIINAQSEVGGIPARMRMCTYVYVGKVYLSIYI